MNSVAPRITSDLKQCKNLQELKTKVRSAKINDGFYRKMLIKLGVLTAFEADF